MKRALVVWFLSFVLFFLPALGESARGLVFEDLNGNGQRDTSEPGIAGVAVSDGRTVVLSDANGLYELEIEAESILFISKPAGFAVPLDEQNRPQFYYRHYPEGSKTAGELRFRGVDATGSLPKSVDFPLTRVVPQENFQVLLLADTQPQNEAELQFLRDDILAELGGSDAAFGLTLGDILYDDLALFPRYSALVSGLLLVQLRPGPLRRPRHGSLPWTGRGPRGGPSPRGRQLRRQAGRPAARVAPAGSRAGSRSGTEEPPGRPDDAHPVGKPPRSG